jgi:hypothetical protein
MGYKAKQLLTLRLRLVNSGIGRQGNAALAGPAASLIAILLLATAGLWAQTPPADAKPDERACHQQKSSTPPETQSQADKESIGEKPNPPSDDACNPDSKDDSEGKQTNRILWIVPNFGAVSANTQLPPLSVKGKFWLATEDTFDYTGFIWTAILAGQEFGSRAYPEFGQGMAGYGRYYYHLFIDGISGAYFTEAIVPSITHEDPRYYTLGHGGFLRRTGYALSRVVLTKTDSEGTSFNWSEVAGNALEAGLSNAYYPPQERGGRQTLINWGAQLESAALNNIVKEFWPDIRRLVFREK